MIFPPSLTKWFTIYSLYLKYKISTENSAEPRLKYEDLPAQTSIYNHIPINGKPQIHES